MHALLMTHNVSGADMKAAAAGSGHVAHSLVYIALTRISPTWLRTTRCLQAQPHISLEMGPCCISTSLEHQGQLHMPCSKLWYTG